MFIFYQIDILIYSALLNFALAMYILLTYTNKKISTKIFLGILFSSSISIILEGSSWLLQNHKDTALIKFTSFTNTSLLIFQIIPAFLWILYVDYKIFQDIEKLKKRLKYYVIPGILIILFVILSTPDHLIFHINVINDFIRGPLYHLYLILLYVHYFIIIGLVLSNRRNVESKILVTIMLIYVIPLIFSILQITVYNLSLVWPAFTLINIMSFMILEKDMLFHDTLTGAYMRGEFEQKVSKLIARHRPFSILMCDVDAFKKINDSLGHSVGDEALVEIAQIISSNKRTVDMLVRYGGDEFMILMQDSDPNAGELLKNRIMTAIKDRNQKKQSSYEIQLSIGVRFVPSDNQESYLSILDDVDKLMYKTKPISHD